MQYVHSARSVLCVVCMGLSEHHNPCIRHGVHLLCNVRMRHGALPCTVHFLPHVHSAQYTTCLMHTLHHAHHALCTWYIVHTMPYACTVHSVLPALHAWCMQCTMHSLPCAHNAKFVLCLMHPMPGGEGSWSLCTQGWEFIFQSSPGMHRGGEIVPMPNARVRRCRPDRFPASHRPGSMAAFPPATHPQQLQPLTS